MRRAAAALFEQLDVQIDASAPVAGLSMADQQLIEIAKALSLDARVLILDEPTASLSAHEVERLFTIVRRLRARGVAVLFVSHRLDEVFELSDRVTVLRDGRHVVTKATAELTTADLVRHMVGRDGGALPTSRAVGDVLLEVDGLTRSGIFQDMSFSVRAGEVVGMAGLVGAGRTEVARVLFGLDRRDAGDVRLAGKAVSFASPGEAMRRRPRLPARGPPPGGPRPGLLDRPERHAADPAAPVPAAAGARLGRARPGRATRSGSTFGCPASTSSPGRCRAATSRRSCWRSGWPPSPGS